METKAAQRSDKGFNYVQSFPQRNVGHNSLPNIDPTIDFLEEFAIL